MKEKVNHKQQANTDQKENISASKQEQKALKIKEKTLQCIFRISVFLVQEEALLQQILIAQISVLLHSK